MKLSGVALSSVNITCELEEGWVWDIASTGRQGFNIAVKRDSRQSVRYKKDPLSDGRDHYRLLT